ncbi:uncharacterized protein LOC144103665 [Amblyomma americanum]
MGAPHPWQALVWDSHVDSVFAPSDIVWSPSPDDKDDTTDEEVSSQRDHGLVVEKLGLEKQGHDPVASVNAAATKGPRLVAETNVFPDQGSSGISADRRGSCLSADSSGLYRPDGFTVGLVAFLFAAFVTIVLLLIRIVGARGWHGAAFAPAAWVKEMDKQCSSTDCLSAVKVIAAAMDVSADPCTNFYAFVCGHWSPLAPSTRKAFSRSVADRNVSYMASLRSDYVAAVNDSLWRVAAGSTPYDEQVNQMGQVYASCLAFFADKPLNLTTAWRAANILTALWLQAKTFQESFFLAVTHLLSFRLLSAVSVAYDGQFVEISPGTAIKGHVSAEFRHVIVTRAIKTLLDSKNHVSGGAQLQLNVSESPGNGSRSLEDVAEAILKIDNVIFNLVVRPGIAPVEVPLHKLDSSQWNWTAVLVAQASKELMALPLTARVTNLEGVRAILEALSSQKDMLVTKVYLMLVPLAEFFALEERVKVHRHLPDDDVRYEVCITALETMFGEVYRRWIVTEFVGWEAAADLKRMVSGVLTAANMQLEIAQGAVLDYAKMESASYPMRMLPLSNDTNPTFMAVYESDFIANTVLFLAGGGRSGRPLLDFDALSTPWSDGQVAERLLIPDFYYAQVGEHVLNYGTIGYYLARLAFQAGSPWPQSLNNSSGWDLNEHIQCLASYARDASRLEMNGDEPWWQDVVQVRWASEAAFRASVLRESRAAQERALAQLFYLRLGHTFCAVPGGGSGRTTAATALRVAAMTLPTFSRTFGCPVMVGIGC